MLSRIMTSLLLLAAATTGAAVTGESLNSNTTVHVSVIYYSQHNHTMKLGAAIAEGAEAVSGVEVSLVSTDEAEMVKHVVEADVVVIGAPVHFGNIAAGFLVWIEDNWTPFWLTHVLDGKLGGVFSTAGGISQGVEHVLTSLQRTLMSYRLKVVVPDCTASDYASYGAMAATATPPFNLTDDGVAQVFLDEAKKYGRQLAEEGLAASRMHAFLARE